MSLNPINLAAGAAVCVLVTILSKDILYDENGYFYKTIRGGGFLLYLVRLVAEIFKSSFSYLARIIKKDSTPFITEVELEVKDPLLVAIIANSITLTPGTITVNVNENHLTVISLKDVKSSEESVRKEIHEKFEKYFI
jgi:multicomponent Na+:H+ antiporter subunit E